MVWTERTELPVGLVVLASVVKMDRMVVMVLVLETMERVEGTVEMLEMEKTVLMEVLDDVVPMGEVCT